MKFSKIAAPTSLGTSCWTCNTSAHKEGFVQFNGRHVQGYGTVALCIGCVYELGRVPGMLDPEQTAQLRGVVDELTETAESLQGQLAAEKINKYVPLADVVDFFDERSKRRPEEPVPVTAPKVSA